MLITKIEPQRNEERVNVYLDGVFAFGILKEILYKYDLYEDIEIDEEYVETVLKAEEQNKANNCALRFLAYRQRSEKEIIDKLTEKDFDDEIIINSISYLKKQNLINDMEFAESYMKDKINLNKFGSQRIKYDLYKKGISKDIIDEVLDMDDDEYERAMELAKKKLPSYKKDDRNAIYRKLGGFLQRKGYSYDCISKVLRELLK